MYFSVTDIDQFPKVEFKFIKTKLEQQLFTITLSRSEKRNAFTPTMVKELAFALAYANHEADVWCIVIEAEGPVFCAGMDLNVFQNPALDTLNETLPQVEKEITLGNAFNSLSKPTIAKVKGNVLAGGFLIIGGCTFVIATKESQFGLPEVKRGIFPMQVMATLLKIMPQRKVLEMCILGKNYTAEEALQLGLVTHLSTQEEIESDTSTLITNILEAAPLAINKGIEAYHSLADIPESQQHAYLINILQQIKSSEDAQEGILAFKEKRKPIWKNK